MVKVARIKILKPLSPVDDWKEFRKLLKVLQGEVQTASNLCMTACNMAYSNIMCGADRKETLKNLGSQLYYTSKESASSLRTDNANMIGRQLQKRYFTGKNSYEWMMKTGKGNPPMSFKKDIAIPIKDMKKGCKIAIDAVGRAEVTIPVLSSAFKKKWNAENPDNKMKDGTFTFAVDSRNGSIRSTLERCASGEYEMCASELVDSEKGLYIHLAYRFDAPKVKELDPKKVCGVDLGVKYAAVCAISNMPERRLFINGANVIQHCIKLESKRRKAQRLAKYDTHDGHGRRPKTELSLSIRNKQANFHKTTNRKYAKDIVDFALKNGCGEIRVEDLGGFSSQHKGDKFLGKWTYYQLQDYITQKADHYGINVVKVKPKNTSRRCSVCGHIEADNRLSQEEFKCIKCGFKSNADLNAAVNIASWAEISK